MQNSHYSHSLIDAVHYQYVSHTVLKTINITDAIANDVNK